HRGLRVVAHCWPLERRVGVFAEEDLIPRHNKSWLPKRPVDVVVPAHNDVQRSSCCEVKGVACWYVFPCDLAHQVPCEQKAQEDFQKAVPKEVAATQCV